jgi:hypothetical protein
MFKWEPVCCGLQADPRLPPAKAKSVFQVCTWTTLILLFLWPLQPAEWWWSLFYFSHSIFILWSCGFKIHTEKWLCRAQEVVMCIVSSLSPAALVSALSSPPSFRVVISKRLVQIWADSWPSVLGLTLRNWQEYFSGCFRSAQWKSQETLRSKVSDKMFFISIHTNVPSPTLPSAPMQVCAAWSWGDTVSTQLTTAMGNLPKGTLPVFLFSSCSPALWPLAFSFPQASPSSNPE